jgi:hypothetical protein
VGFEPTTFGFGGYHFFELKVILRVKSAREGLLGKNAHVATKKREIFSMREILRMQSIRAMG